MKKLISFIILLFFLVITTFVPVKGEKPANVVTTIADEKSNIIENEFFRIKIDPSKGAVTSIIDKKSGKEVGNPHNYSISFTLHKDLPFIELNWFIDGKQAEPWSEAGWICFPFKVDNPEFKVGRLGAVIDPAKDIIKGSDFDFYLINNGVALHDKQQDGFGLSTPDAPGISFDRPGLWKYSGNFIPKRPNIFVNL